MAGDWIKWVKGLTRRTEVIQIAAGLKLDRRLVAAVCMEFWEWVDDSTTDGNLPGCNSETVDSVVCVPGFGSAMVRVGWLIETPNGMAVAHFDRHNSASSKARALNALRQSKYRERDPRNGTPSRERYESNAPTITREEKRREEDKTKDIAKPPEAANAAKVGKAGVKHLSAQDAKAYALPMHWPTEVREAFVSFIESRYAAGKRCTPKALDLLIKAVESMPPAARLASVNQSIANGYQGIFPAKTTGKGNDVRGTRRNEVVGDSDEHIDIPIYRADASGRVSRQTP
jgi:hypothetical protein